MTWTPEPRPVPQELEPTYRAQPYRDPLMTPVLEKLSQADRDALIALMGGYPIDPSVTDA